MDQQPSSTGNGNDDKQLHEIVPGTYRVPGVRRLGLDALETGPAAETQPGEWHFRVPSVEEAEDNRRTAIDEASKRYSENGDCSGITNLAEVAREFGWAPSFGELLADLRRAEQHDGGRRGHPFGHSDYVKNRMRLVYGYIEGLREQGVSLRRILDAMENRGFGNVARQQLLRDYKEARRWPEFQPQLFLREDHRRYAYLERGKASPSFVVTGLRVVFPYQPPSNFTMVLAVNTSHLLLPFS